MTTFQLLDKKWYQSRHLNIRDLGRIPGRKTRRYEIRQRRNGSLIGSVVYERGRYRLWINPFPKGGRILSIWQEAEDFCWFLTSELHKAAKKPNHKKVRLNRIQALLKKPDGGGLDKRYAPVIQ
jgi:hypothetical protein